LDFLRVWSNSSTTFGLISGIVCARSCGLIGVQLVVFLLLTRTLVEIKTILIHL